MAGESPGKSEQRKSSGEGTSTSTSPQDGQEQDPRFAVFRESAATAGEAERAGTDKSDTPEDAPPAPNGSANAAADGSTAVFTVRGAAGGSGAPEAAEVPVTASEGSSAGEPDATEGSTAPKPPREPEPELESTTEPKSEPTFAPAKPAPEADPSEPEPASDSAAEPEAGTAADAAPAPQPGSGSTESAAGAASDAGPEPKADARPKSPSGPAGADGPGVDRKTAVFTALKPEAEDTPLGSATAPKGDVGSAAREATSGPEAAPARGVEPEAGTADAAPKSGSGSPESTAGAGSDSSASSASGSTPDGPGVDRKTAVFNALKSAPASKPGSGDGPAGPEAPGTGPEARSDSRTAADAASASASGSAQPDADSEPGVDRKTAVFRALKTDSAPAKPDARPDSPSEGVDQPTAMLKLPPQPAELPAERTSKFVPLRADEVRAPAPPAGRPVVEAERTRQQPMPPLPPLDLLAELTNKPAPPETPTRTVVRRVKIWTPLLVLVLIIFAVVQVVRPLPTPSLKLTANSAYTFEGDKPALPWPGEGQGFMAATGLGTVDSFGEQKAVPIGSVAKAMTAYVVLKDKPLKKGEQGPSITVDAKAEEDGGLDAQGESTLNTVKEGDKLTQHDALAALMIPSANNIARLLARWDTGGSEEEFVKKMNDTAAELGMKNTEYTDPSGLDATTVSSAEDQVKLGQELVEIEALMDITKLPEWTDPSGKTWRNYNTLVPYDGALGIKTGSTTKAGGNLLFAAHKMVGDTDQLIVGAILGQHQAPIIDTVNAASKEVMGATQDELDGATIVKKGQVVGEVDNGMGTKVPLVAVADVKAVGWSGLTVKLELADGAKAVPQSAAAGTHVGTLTVGEGKSQVEVAVALQSDLAEASFLDKLTRVG